MSQKGWFRNKTHLHNRSHQSVIRAPSGSSFQPQSQQWSQSAIRLCSRIHFRNRLLSLDHIDETRAASPNRERVKAMTAKTANISLEVDAGVKKRAMSVLEAKGMSLSGAIRRMVTLGILEHRIPFEVDARPRIRRRRNVRLRREALRHRQESLAAHGRRYGDRREDDARFQAGDARVLQGDVHHA